MAAPPPSSHKSRVLILAPTGNDAANAVAVLAKAQIQGDTCAHIQELCLKINDTAGALLLTEETLDANSLAVLQQSLQRQPPWSDLPLLLLAKPGETSQRVHHILHALGTAGNVTLLERPLRALTLVRALEVALRSRQRQYQVRELLESYSLAMDGAQMGSWDLDLRSGVCRRSLRHDQLFGYESSLPHWSLQTFQEHVFNEDRPWVKDFFQRALVTGNLAFECRIQWPDQSIHWIANRGRVYYEGEGDAVRMAGVIWDVTERKREEQLLRRTKAELQQTAAELERRVTERTAKLEQALMDMETFSYSVSHDLRAPLRAMQGFSSMVLEDCADHLDANSKELLTRIKRSAQRLDRLTQDLLTYNRITKTELKLEPLALEPLIQNVIQNYLAFQSPQAEIIIQSPLLNVLGHEGSVIQCVSNLISNGVKFVASGTRPRIKIWTESLPGQVRINFEDNGIGIEAHQVERIFKMFERLHPQFDGTGIGLAIVRKAAERMGGKVGVESKLRQGSKFWLHLPAAP